jgi:TolA-binding protein
LTTLRTSRPRACDLGGVFLRRAVSATERQLRDAHLSSCSECRMLARLGADLDPLGDLRPGDEAVVAAAAEAAISRLGRVDWTVKRRATPGLLALVLWIGASAAAVAAGSQLVRLASYAAEGRIRDRIGAHRSRRGDVAPVPIRPLAQPPPIAVAEAVRSPRPVSVAIVAAQEPRAPSVTRTAGSIERLGFAEASAPLLVPTARQLLAAGTTARASGDRTGAVDFFRQLQDLHPGTAEARVALVSSGQLLLDAGDFAGAAAAFIAYRRQAPAGALVEEALDGLARSFAGLQRFDDERQVWRELSIRFPRSAYLPRATQRLRGVAR